MSPRGIFLFIYFVSGAAALLYEVAWSRLLTLHMGHTVAAVSTVLAAFMGGLAIGAAAAGRLAWRLRPAAALRAYGALEIGIAACALMLPVALAALTPLLKWAYADGAGGAWFGFVRVVSSLALVAIPAAAMGATFPVAVRWFVGSAERAGWQAGGLYAVNTVGAAAGAAAAGFVLLPGVGLYGTTYVGMTLNVMAAAGAFWLAAVAATPVGQLAPAGPLPGRAHCPKPARIGARAATRVMPTAGVGRPWLAASILGVSGFVALALEVAWARALALVMGPTTYAFSTMLSAFIVGLGIGAIAGARLARDTRQPAFWLGLSLAGASLGAVLAAALVDRVPLVVAEAVAAADASFASVVRIQALLAVGLLLPMTVALGAAFPLAVSVAARRHDTVPADTALVYAVNTVGAIAGALAGGFLLIPLVGLQQTMLIAGALAAAGGAVAVLSSGAGRMRTLAALGVAGAAFVGIGTLPPWDRDLLSSGAYKYASSLPAGDLRSALEAGQVLYYAEGGAATVSVRRVAGAASMAIDGKRDASPTGEMLTQKPLAHLPLLLHPDPAELMVLGLGSGVTLGAALAHPTTRHVDVVEISPEVVEASSFFEVENRNALRDPRTHLIVGDGRSHLLLSSRTYDVIISEPSNPWMAGIAQLFTREFFAAVRDRLAPGGLFCQWAHTYDISDRDLRSIVATFLAAFPEATLWLLGEGDLLLIGGREPVEARVDLIEHGWGRPGVAADLARVGVREPFGMLSLFVAGRPALGVYAAGAPILTDSRPGLEFSGPRTLYGRPDAQNVARLRALAESADRPEVLARALARAGAVQWRDRGGMFLGAEAYGAAYDDFARAMALDPRDEAALSGLARAAGGSGRIDEARRRLEAVAAADADNGPARIELSRLLAGQGAFDQAVRAAEEAHAAAPGDPRPMEQLASLFAERGDPERLAGILDRLRAVRPDDPATRYYEAALFLLSGRLSPAIRLATELTARSAGEARAHNLLGAAFATLGQRDRARLAFEAAVRADPRDPSTYVNLGMLELQSANPAVARQRFAEALTLDPGSPAALDGLATALERQGDRDRARRLRRLLLPGVE